MSLSKCLNLAPNSRKTYRGQHIIFLRYCKAYGLEPLAISEDELLRVMAHYVCGHTSGSLDSYASAIQNLYTEAGAGDLPRGQVYKLGMRGLKRIFESADEVVRMRALSLDEVAAMLRQLDWNVAADVSFGAQLLLGFMLALRPEDYTDGRLQWGDFGIEIDGSVQFYLQPGKSSRTKRRVAVAARTGVLNLAAWLTRLSSFLPRTARSPTDPVFVSFTRMGQAGPLHALSRSAFIARLKKAAASVTGEPQHLFAAYSLRRGAVTAMLMALVPMPIIKAHAGWTPDSQAIHLYYDHHGHEQQRIPTAALQLRQAQ